MKPLIDTMEKAALRKSGIGVLGDIPWGTHLCQFYETKEDLINILIPYFVEGLRNNEFCVWVTSPPLDAEEARAALQAAVPDLERYLKRGQIEIMPYTFWYLLGGEFNLERVLQGWVEKEKYALERGFDGLRLTGNTFWLERKLWDSFVEYEASVNNVIRDYRMIAICTYSIEKCTASDVIEVIKNHKSTLIKKEESWYVVEDILKRKLADKKIEKSQADLTRSENKYSQLIENLKEGIWVIDEKAQTIFTNESMAEILGYTVDEMLGRHLFSFMDEKGVEIAKINLERRRRRITEDHDFEFIRKDGTRIYTRLSTSPILDVEGKYAGAIAAVMDITDLKRMEEALRDSEKRYRGLFEYSPISLWEEDFSEVKKHIENLRNSGITDFRTYFENHPEALNRCASMIKIVDVNNATLEMYQAKEKEELIGSLSQVFNQETYDEFREELLALIEGKPIFECEAINKTLTGESKQVSLRLLVAPGYEKTWSKVFVSILDITEHKRAEEALRESENKYSALVESSKDIIVIVQDGLLKFINTASKQLGHNPEELVGTNFLNYVVPDFRELVLKRYTDRMAGKEVPSIYEIEVLNKDGTILPVELNTVRINFQGKPAEMAFARDITERKRMEEELRHYSEHLEELVEERTKRLRDAERMATIGETAATVGHDLRNPLQVIIGSIYLARGKLNSITEHVQEKYGIEEQLLSIEEQTDYMNKIVSDLQDFARPVEPQLVETDLNQLIAETLSTINVPKKIKTSIEIEEGFPRLVVDPAMMRRVFSNLITNALQSMPEGGKLTITGYKYQDTALINVRDTGEGIPEENLSKIFQPLFTTKPRGQGFGLPVCRRLVEAHGGNLTVESKVGKGSTFTVKIPLGLNGN